MCIFFSRASIGAMTKHELKRRLKAKGEACTDRAIAEIFDIKYQAVQQWPLKKAFPVARYYELLVKRPDLVRS